MWKDVDKENFDFDLTILIGNLYELYNWFYALLNKGAAYITYRDTTESLIHSVDMLERNNYFLSAVTKKCLKMTIFERQKYFLVEYIKKELTKSELAILDILGKGYSKKKIADLRSRSINTVKTQKKSVRNKINTDSTKLSILTGRLWKPIRTLYEIEKKRPLLNNY